MREIHLFKAERLRQVIGIERRAYVIGRSTTADIIIADHRVSRKHCTLYYDNHSGRYHVADLNSKLGTYLNGRRLTGNSPLAVNDVISFGARSEFMLRFTNAGADSSTSNAPPQEPATADASAELTEDDKRITSSFNARQVIEQSEARFFQRSVEAGRPSAKRDGDKASPLETEEVAGAFYDLSRDLALASHHQQVFEVLASHVFKTLPADRMLVIRTDSKRGSQTGFPRAASSEDELRIETAESASMPTPAPAPPSQPRPMRVEFCEFAPKASSVVKNAGAEFSRSMTRKAVEEQRAFIFTSKQNVTESLIALRPQSSICAPLLARSSVLGCLYLDTFAVSRKNGFESIHLKKAGMFAYIFSLYLERQKAFEEKSESERLASAGLAVFGAAHYLKNVLTGLQGSRQLIDMHLASKQYDQLPSTWGVMTRSLDTIGATIRKMLDYARSSRLELLNAHPVQLLREALEPFQDLFREKRIGFRFEQSGDPFPILCDPTAIGDVLQNLISNAIDAFKYDRRPIKPEPRIVARTLFHVEPNVVEFEIEDNGPGIPADAQPRLFDLFFSTKGSGGSGLGLALCHKYIVAHNGSLTFTTSGAGTVFRVALPQGDIETSGSRSPEQLTLETH